MQYLRMIDFISPKFFLFTSKNGESNFKSKLGGILTLIAYTCCISASVYFVQDFFSNAKPNINMNEENKNSTIFELSTFPLIIRLTGDTGDPFSQPDKLYKIVFNYITTHYDSQGAVIQDYNFISTSPCDLNTHIPLKYRQLFNSTDLSTFYCVNFNKNSTYPMSGLYGSNTLHKFASFRVYQCATTVANNTCYNQTFIDNSLVSSYLEYAYPDYSLSSVGKNPGIANFVKVRTAINNQNYFREWVGIRSINYTTDSGILFQSMETVNFHKVIFYKETIKGINYNSIASGLTYFAMISVQNDPTYTFYNRSFTKAQELLASMGGVINGILILAKMTYFILGNKMAILSLSKHISLLRKAEVFKDENLQYDIEKLNNIRITKDEKTIVRFNNFTIKDSSIKTNLNKGFELINRKLQLTWYQKYLSFWYCKSREMRIYRKK